MVHPNELDPKYDTPCKLGDDSIIDTSERRSGRSDISAVVNGQRPDRNTKSTRQGCKCSLEDPLSETWEADSLLPFGKVYTARAFQRPIS